MHILFYSIYSILVDSVLMTLQFHLSSTVPSFDRVSNLPLPPPHPAVQHRSVRTLRLGGVGGWAGGQAQMNSSKTPSRPRFPSCKEAKRESCRWADFNEDESRAHYRASPHAAPSLSSSLLRCSRSSPDRLRPHGSFSCRRFASTCWQLAVCPRLHS